MAVARDPDVRTASTDHSEETEGAPAPGSGIGSGRELWIVGDIFMDIQASVDRLPPSWDSDTISHRTDILPGGSGANTARQLWSLAKMQPFAPPETLYSQKPGAGAPSTSQLLRLRFFSAVGMDGFGDAFKGVCRAEGLECADIAVFDKIPTSTCIVLSAVGGANRAFVSCYSTTDAMRYSNGNDAMRQTETSTSIFALRAELRGRYPSVFGAGNETSDGDGQEQPLHLHIGGFFNLIGLHDEEFVQDLWALREKGLITVSLATQYDARETWLGQNGKLINFLGVCDLLFVNTVELRNIARHGRDRARDIAGKITMPSNAIVVETRGAEGARCFGFAENQKTFLGKNVGDCEDGTLSLEDANEEDVHRLALVGEVFCCPKGRRMRLVTSVAAEKIPSESVVDATGAGDAFVSGFLWRWVVLAGVLSRRGIVDIGGKEKDLSLLSTKRKEDLAEAVKCGHIIAAQCIGKSGACPAPCEVCLSDKDMEFFRTIHC